MDMINEVKNLNEKIDKLQNHFTVYKTDISDLKDVVRQLTSALVGSNYNGNKGIIHLVDAVEKRLDTLERQQPLNDETIKQVKFGLGVIFTALIGGIFSFISWYFSK